MGRVVLEEMRPQSGTHQEIIAVMDGHSDYYNTCIWPPFRAIINNTTMNNKTIHTFDIGLLLPHIY